VTYAYTLFNPDDDMMNKNMEYYQNHENTTADMFVNNDVPPHIAAYDQGCIFMYLILFHNLLLQFNFSG